MRRAGTSLLALSLVAAVSSAAIAQRPSNSMIVSTEWLAQHLNDPTVVVLHVVHDTTDYRTGHIPGAREILYSDFTTVRDSNSTELPAPEELKKVFERLGVSDESHVVIYTGGMGMAPMASRAFLTLDYIGLPNVSLLRGGMARWRAEGRPVSMERPKVTPGRITPKSKGVTVDAAYVMAHAGHTGYSFIDTRTDPEYLGSGERSGLRSDGHVVSARQLQWEQLFASSDSMVFLDRDAIAKLFADRSRPGDTVVTYCLVGYRASMTYFGARLAGLPVKIYDGSYQDWARKKLPVVKGPEPGSLA